MSDTMSKAAAKPVKKKNELVETIVVIIEALLIALVFRTFLYQPFSIPTASMHSRIDSPVVTMSSTMMTFSPLAISKPRRSSNTPFTRSV